MPNIATFIFIRLFVCVIICTANVSFGRQYKSKTFPLSKGRYFNRLKRDQYATAYRVPKNQVVLEEYGWSPRQATSFASTNLLGLGPSQMPPTEYVYPGPGGGTAGNSDEDNVVAAGHSHGWGWQQSHHGHKDKNEINNSAVGMLGFLTLLALIQMNAGANNGMNGMNGMDMGGMGGAGGGAGMGGAGMAGAGMGGAGMAGAGMGGAGMAGAGAGMGAGAGAGMNAGAGAGMGAGAGAGMGAGAGIIVPGGGRFGGRLKRSISSHSPYYSQLYESTSTMIPYLLNLNLIREGTWPLNCTSYTICKLSHAVSRKMGNIRTEHEVELFRRGMKEITEDLVLSPVVSTESEASDLRSQIDWASTVGIKGGSCESYFKIC